MERKSLDHGFNTANRLNPAGDNYVANFTRGFTYYFSDEQSTKREAEINTYFDAWKATKR